jgi:5-methyltetrahydropteroyltriglutamate--homocysteine methyltransferase
MRRSIEHILTTHTGSLPRPDELRAAILAAENGEAGDPDRLAALVSEAVRGTVRRQLEIGLDVVNDGEQGKPSYSTYVKDRLSGFGGPPAPPRRRAESDDFPGYPHQPGGGSGRGIQFPTCDGPVAVKDPGAVRREIANLKAAVDERATEVFMTAVSPGQISRFLPNGYYPSHEAYVFALAEAMQDEYRAIVEAGFVLQLDCPDLASGRSNGEFAGLPLEEWKQIAAMHVAAMNEATRGLPTEQIRVHLCWGNYEGPHHTDVPLRDILDVVLGARCGALSFEAANPRHAHEWKVWREAKLPDGMLLIPGVIDSCTNYIEHPELVAERLANFASVVGAENVIAGTDCGFGTSVESSKVYPPIAWAKLGALVEGARLATMGLLGRSRESPSSDTTRA